MINGRTLTDGTGRELDLNDLGRVRDVFSRIRKGCEREGLVRDGRGRIVVCARAGLERAARDDRDRSS